MNIQFWHGELEESKVKIARMEWEFLISEFLKSTQGNVAR